MLIIIDTNIIFSAILKPNGIIANQLNQLSQTHDIFISNISLIELSKHQNKILRFSNQEENTVELNKKRLIDSISIIYFNDIPSEIVKMAQSLTEEIDIADMPFVATTIFMNGILWTGDKKLYNGLLKKTLVQLYLHQKLKKF